MEFLLFLIVLFLFGYSVLWLTSYDESLKFIELSKHLDAVQYVRYNQENKTIRYAIFSKNGKEVLTINMDPSHIFMFDNISNEGAISCAVPCWITMYMINKKLMSLVPEDVLKDFNSKPVKRTFKDEL